MFDGNIYKIVSSNFDKIYIGSTSLSLEERLVWHETDFEEWLTHDFKKQYLSSFEILKYGDYKIELLEFCPNVIYKEMYEREKYYQIINYKDTVNIRIAGTKPAPSEINTNDIYTCTCGSKLLNNYRHRMKHSMSSVHRLKIREIHSAMIVNNPRFEVVEVPNYIDFIFNKNGNILNIFY